MHNGIVSRQSIINWLSFNFFLCDDMQLLRIATSSDKLAILLKYRVENVADEIGGVK